MPRGYASGVIISQPGQTREHARHTPRTESGMYKPPPVGADWTWNPPIIGADGAVLFFRLRQLPASSRPLLSDRDSSAEIAPCSASESSDASELILETSLAAAVSVRNAALCSPVKPDVMMYRRSPLNSPLHPAIFFGSVKFVDLGVLYFSLVLPGQPTLGCPWPSVEFKVLGRYGMYESKLRTAGAMASWGQV